MSTRATIKINGIMFAKVYKHYDGNPESTLAWLKEFNEDFSKERGDDPEYKFAQLLRSSIRDAAFFNLDDSKHTGWGVIPYCMKYGADYEYTLHEDGKVTVQELDGSV